MLRGSIRAESADPADVIDRNPEIILASWCGKPVRIDEIMARDGWDEVDAIRNRHVYEVKSAIIRLIKHAFTVHGISMPDDAREVIFPQGIQVTTIPGKTDETTGRPPNASPRANTSPQAEEQHSREAASCTPAEGELTTETRAINAQAENSNLGEGKTTLLK